MIVRMDYPDEGDEHGFYVADPQHETLDASQLYSHRVIPDKLWLEYVSARAVADELEARISAHPLLPRFVEWGVETRARQARIDKMRRDADARYKCDLDAQEEIRVAGLLRPLPLDCPEDEPVRIGDPRGQKIV